MDIVLERLEYIVDGELDISNLGLGSLDWMKQHKNFNK